MYKLYEIKNSKIKFYIFLAFSNKKIISLNSIYE